MIDISSVPNRREGKQASFQDLMQVSGFNLRQSKFDGKSLLTFSWFTQHVCCRQTFEVEELKQIFCNPKTFVCMEFIYSFGAEFPLLSFFRDFGLYRKYGLLFSRSDVDLATSCFVSSMVPCLTHFF